MDANEWLPAINALLNATSAGFLLGGYRRIRRGDRDGHRRAMLGATAASALFLLSYVVSKLLFGTTYFGGQGWVRAVYLIILTTHTILAMVIVPLALMTLVRGLRGHYAAHRRIARWTLPLWLYVSVTGVVVYLMLRPYY